MLGNFHAFGVSMRCASVDNLGGVSVTWDLTGTTGANFLNWELYHSTNPAGPFTLLPVIPTPYNIPTLYDPAANAANNPAYYYVIYKTNDGSPDIFSDTIRAIGLNVNNPGNGYADLSWAATHYPLIATNSPYYLIYREYPVGIFTLIDSVDAGTAPVPMTYTDPISICDDTVKYRIEVKDNSGCVSVSPVKGDRFQDRQVPVVPVVDSVSVDILGNSVITWFVSGSPDVASYGVYQEVNGNLIFVNTVAGHNSTILNSVISAVNASQNFVVLAIDSCNNSSGASLPHSTIFLQVSFGLCTRSADLTWNPYSYWGSQPEYEISVSVNGGAETVIGTTTSTNFSDTNLISGANFCYRVRAVDGGGIRSSTSNRACMTPNFPPPLLFSEIRTVSVIAENEVLVVAFVDPAPTVRGYDLNRSTSPTGPFEVVSSILVTNTSSVSFVDNVPTNAGPYYYFVTTVDSCGNRVLDSQVSRTILLTGSSGGSYVNSFEWTSYGDWPPGVDHYNIYRRVNGILSVLPIATITDTTIFSYLDSVINNFYSDGEFCYVIEAVEAPGNPTFFIDSSLSNELCLDQVPVIFIPNAFHPGGFLNDIFYPSNGFVSAENYSLDIYNRWGENIFHTNDPRKGWDGSTNGISAPEAVYIYRLLAKDQDGGDIERVGSVTLIR